MTQPKSIIVTIKLPSERAYNVAWGIALMKGYDSLEECINDWFYEMINIYAEGRAGLDLE